MMSSKRDIIPRQRMMDAREKWRRSFFVARPTPDDSKRHHDQEDQMDPLQFEPFPALWGADWRAIRWACSETPGKWQEEVPRAGLEPATCGLEDRCSIQLSYRGNKRGEIRQAAGPSERRDGIIAMQVRADKNAVACSCDFPASRRHNRDLIRRSVDCGQCC